MTCTRRAVQRARCFPPRLPSPLGRFNGLGAPPPSPPLPSPTSIYVKSALRDCLKQVLGSVRPCLLPRAASNSSKCNPGGQLSTPKVSSQPGHGRRCVAKPHFDETPETGIRGAIMSAEREHHTTQGLDWQITKIKFGTIALKQGRTGQNCPRPDKSRTGACAAFTRTAGDAECQSRSRFQAQGRKPPSVFEICLAVEIPETQGSARGFAAVGRRLQHGRTQRFHRVRWASVESQSNGLSKWPSTPRHGKCELGRSSTAERNACALRGRVA